MRLLVVGWPCLIFFRRALPSVVSSPPLLATLRPLLLLPLPLLLLLLLLPLLPWPLS